MCLGQMCRVMHLSNLNNHGSATNGQHSSFKQSNLWTLHRLVICSPPKSRTTQQNHQPINPQPFAALALTETFHCHPPEFPKPPGRETYLARWPRDCDTIRSPHDQIPRNSPHQTQGCRSTPLWWKGWWVWWVWWAWEIQVQNTVFVHAVPYLYHKLSRSFRKKWRNAYAQNLGNQHPEVVFILCFQTYEVYR